MGRRRIAAAAHYESQLGEAFFQFHPDYRRLRGEMLDYAEENLDGISKKDDGAGQSRHAGRHPALGPKVAYVGSDQAFYMAIGFRVIHTSECWVKYR